MIDLLTGLLVNKFPGHEGRITSIAISKDGKYMVSGSVDKTARLWDTRTGRNLAVLQHKNPVLQVAIHPEAHKIVTTDGRAHKWDSRGMLLHTFGGH